jgi:glucose/arabinose dehydrogenase
MRRFAWLIASLASLVSLAGCASGSTAENALTAAPRIATAPAAPTNAPAATTGAPAAATNPPAAPTAAGAAGVALRLISGALDRPVYVTSADDDSGRLFVVQKAGTIVLLRGGKIAPQPFLDITDRVGSQGSEQGLLSVAFHPHFAQNGYLFVDYTDLNGNTVVARYTASGDTADPASEKVLLHIDQPYPNHNGGLVLFGPDSYLYIGMGDGGSAGDPHGNGQNLDALLGKLLRIDVDSGDPYAIPPDNPALGGRREVWAYGLRNPWRFSFDRKTRDLYIGDVGQDAVEEIDMQPAKSHGGENYGWNVMEGDTCFRSSSCNPKQFVAPIATYRHDLGCSVIGGYVYRGAAIPALQAAYIFGDYCSGRIWTLRAGSGGWQRSDLFNNGMPITSFGEDQAGELYLTTLDGKLYQFVVGGR